LVGALTKHLSLTSNLFFKASIEQEEAEVAEDRDLYDSASSAISCSQNTAPVSLAISVAS
jgi:hypothetical protein